MNPKTLAPTHPRDQVPDGRRRAASFRAAAQHRPNAHQSCFERRKRQKGKKIEIYEIQNVKFQVANQHFGSSSERTKGGFEGANGKVEGADPEAAAQAAAAEQRLEEKDLLESAERSDEMNKLINLSAPSFGDSEIKKEKILEPFSWHQNIGKAK